MLCTVRVLSEQFAASLGGALDRGEQNSIPNLEGAIGEKFHPMARLAPLAAQCLLGRDMVIWWAARLRESEQAILLDNLVADASCASAAHKSRLLSCTAAIAWIANQDQIATRSLRDCLQTDRRNSLGILLATALQNDTPREAFRAALAAMTIDQVHEVLPVRKRAGDVVECSCPM